MTVNDHELYRHTYEAARDLLGQAPKVTLDENSALYRYVSYFQGNPQEGPSGMVIRTALAQDVNNRWTGSNQGALTSVTLDYQGLYLSLPHPGPHNTHFAELEHYQESEAKDTTALTDIEFTLNGVEWKKYPALAFRTLFLFTLTKKLSGLDLRLAPTEGDDGATLVGQIYSKIDPAIIRTRPLRTLYLGDDHSFTRALGNACLAKPGVRFFYATSARDLGEVNVDRKSVGRERV